MRWRNIVFMTSVLLFMLSSSVASQEWIEIKDPKELRALHSNKTFRCHVREVPFTEHYRSDGKGIWIFSGKHRLACTWKVKGNDQVCVSTESGTSCWQFQRSKKNPNEYVKKNPDTAYMQIFKLEDGIPEF